MVVVVDGAQGADLVDPDTGEVFPIAAASDALLAVALDDLADHQRQLTSWRRALDDEVIARMDAAVRWTIHAGPFRLSAPSAAPVAVYDAQPLRGALTALANAGRFGQGAVDAAVVVATTYTARAGGLKALAKLGPDVQEVIDRYTTRVDRPRSVRVSRT